MKTILGFDSWTAGARHFERLVPELMRLGYRLVLIHIGSWGHDKGRPPEEYIGELLTRDISYYRGASFAEILRLENPSGILFISTRGFAHMTFNRYARHVGIPSCLLYHGLVTVQAVGEGVRPYKINFIRKLSIIRSRLGKNLFRLIPLYVKALMATNAPFSAWRDIFSLIISKAYDSYRVKNILTDSYTDIGCVYTAADVSHMQVYYGVLSKNIFVVGNPDLLSFGLSTDDISCALCRRDDNSEVLYIETALIAAGVCFNDVDDFVNHLKYTHEQLASTGLRLVVKLKPHAHGKTGVPEKLERLGILLCENDTFLARLKKAKAAMVEPSSAAMIPALTGLPLLLVQYGKLSGQAYGKVLTSYPRSRFLTQLGELPEILQEEREHLNPETVRAWIEHHSGPMPAENMPDRVANAIDNMVKHMKRPDSEYQLRKQYVRDRRSSI